ncbi:unnamed protein product [Amoebophrya sp. A120]|nr:unnamed protein product [Amoebophrya sp. A120]|eukprot:GSA120T00010290001.1
MGCCHSIHGDEVAIVETFGKYAYSQGPGLMILPCPCVQVNAGTISTRIRQLSVPVETKTKDNVFVDARLEIQYVADQSKVYEAFYRLASPEQQLNSYVFDVVRSAVPKHTLDDLYLHAAKDAIADEVRKNLTNTMREFGYIIVKTLVTDITPAQKVRVAMNDIETSKRNRQAATEKADADKMMIVKRAEADAVSKYHQGAGIARQRKAIIDGMQNSVGTFTEAIEGMRSRDVLELVLITQYFDTLKEIGSSAGSKTIFVNSSAGSVQGIASEIRNAFLQSTAAKK